LEESMEITVPLLTLQRGSPIVAQKEVSYPKY
jgi:hypothetical protein